MKQLDMLNVRGVLCACVDTYGNLHHYYEEGTRTLLDIFSSPTLWEWAVIKIGDNYYTIYTSWRYMIFDDKDAAIAAMVLEANKGDVQCRS